MLSEQSSGLKRAAAASRSSTVIVAATPAVVFTTASVCWRLAGTKREQQPGSPSGWPPSGLRAWRWRNAAPASLAPTKLPRADPLGGGEEGEVERAHVDPAEFRLEAGRRGKPLVHRHRRGPAGGDVDHRIGLLADRRQETGINIGIAGRSAVFGYAGMEMENRRPGLSRIDRLFGDFLGGDGQRIGHGDRKSVV